MSEDHSLDSQAARVLLYSERQIIRKWRELLQKDIAGINLALNIKSPDDFFDLPHELRIALHHAELTEIYLEQYQIIYDTSGGTEHGIPQDQ